LSRPLILPGGCGVGVGRGRGGGGGGGGGGGPGEEPVVDVVKAVGADVARDGAEGALDSESVALAVQIGDGDEDCDHPDTGDDAQSSRLGREDLCVDRMYDDVVANSDR